MHGYFEEKTSHSTQGSGCTVVLEELCPKIFPDLQLVQLRMDLCYISKISKKLAAPLPQTIILEQEMLWDTAVVEVVYLSTSTCTTGNAIMKITRARGFRQNLLYLVSIFFLFN